MIITYDKKYSKRIKGIDWQLYSCVALNDTIIVHTLQNVVLNNPQLSFEDMHVELKNKYKSKTAKSRCDIYKNDNRIEVTVKGVFPKFYIEKDKTITWITTTINSLSGQMIW